MVKQFSAERHRAQEALILGHHFQTKAYNKGRLTLEFSEGDSVLLNPHSLSLLRNEKGRGKKLLMKYDRPFKVIQKLSPVSYRLTDASFIWHSSNYQYCSPGKIPTFICKFGNHPTKHLNREDFEALPEYEVNKIITERRKRVRMVERLFNI